jgi:hypothetical protein
VLSGTPESPRSRSTYHSGDENEGDGRGGDGDSGGEDGGRVVGSLRGYLQRDRGREFDVTDPQTIESRVVDPDDPMWYMPSGREPYLKRRPSTRASDVRSRDIGRFRAADFTARATDDRGHKESLTVPLPPHVRNELAAIVESGVFPARSSEALARRFICDGIMLIHEIARQDGLTIRNSHPQHLEALARLGRSMASVLAYDDMLEKLCDVVRDLEGRRMRNKARVSVHEMLAIIEKVDSREVREQWLSRIRREFGHLLRGRPAQIHVAKEEQQVQIEIDEDESE